MWPIQQKASAAAQPSDGFPDDGEALPELADADWMHHARGFAETSFWTVARRLPGILAEAVKLAWSVSPRDTVAAIGLNVVAGVMTTFGLLATSSVLRELFASGPTPDRIRAAAPALAVAALAVAARGGLTIAAGWAQARLMPQVTYRAELRLFEATTSVELAAFDDAGFAEEMDRARDRGTVEAASIVDDAVNLTTGVVGVAATAAAVTVIEPLLLPCLLLAAVPAAVTAIRIARREYLALLARITRRRRMWMLAHLMANRHTAAEIRTYQMRDFLLGEYHRTMTTETRAQLRLVRAQTGTRVVGGAFSGTAAFVVYAVLGGLLLVGMIPLAAAATAMIALQAARANLNTAIHATNALYEDALYYRDYRDFLARADRQVPPAGGRRIGGYDEIELDGVSLSYPDTDRPAVDGVSLTLRRGEVVALVGENGSGKSSLAKLIAGLYRPSSGTIRWDGVDIDEIDPQRLAGQVAVVSQDWWRFPFTAGQNITIGRPGHDQAEPGRPDHHQAAGDRVRPSMVDAATAATAHDMIESLPRGYRTLLDRNFREGHDLSGGQWQRLVAARGIYRDAPLLICDEPSAALDARAEHALFQQLRRRPDRTVVLITHRLANVRQADRIYVLRSGRLVEAGTHDELLAADGLYRELFELQASGYADTPVG
ncbi:MULTISPECIES: ABC transporter ATP-binding protein [unclassified Solwaraspora]|uniref:ABC transporter ATP-binding protein n=1 Tax=unclassified Solwaraspora TaxID=2627926 RepID=UPI00248C593B|nr:MULTISPECIES: ABC transporter ATP-binding protein [unclassified Solwaraspora]WBB96637.1 ABC transporter ATP-binding protein [Solwaraspora sp. WMMA2059]WBC19459.1 ABC transporter ATP-binding protein [Solwaraspora sp. WMMA2080]WJK32958.1 ABC transporter ATP-binding protein [Solwaraspora sp. WMMA2065]